MTNEKEQTLDFSELGLNVGTRLQLISHKKNGKVASFSSLIGFQKNRFLFVSPPQINHMDLPVTIGEHVDVRVFTGVSVIDFSCTIDAIHKNRHEFIELSYPRNIKSIPLRRDPRINLIVPIRIKKQYGDEAPELFMTQTKDISVSGAMLESETEIGEVGETIEFSFNLNLKNLEQNFMISQKATIRSQQRKIDENNVEKYLCGIQFEKLNDQDFLMLQNFVFENLLSNRKP